MAGFKPPRRPLRLDRRDRHDLTPRYGPRRLRREHEAAGRDHQVFLSVAIILFALAVVLAVITL